MQDLTEGFPFCDSYQVLGLAEHSCLLSDWSCQSRLPSKLVQTVVFRYLMNLLCRAMLKMFRTILLHVLEDTAPILNFKYCLKFSGQCLYLLGHCRQVCINDSISPEFRSLPDPIHCILKSYKNECPDLGAVITARSENMLSSNAEVKCEACWICS